MMSIFDPIEKKRISELLANGQAIAAAQLLLASHNREHKAIRSLVLDCIAQLMEFASRLLSGGDLQTAADHSRLAKRLMELSGNDAKLATEIENLLESRDQQIKKEQKMLDKVRQLSADRRLDTAIEHSSNLSPTPYSRSLIDSIEAELKAYQRYVDNCQQAIERGSLSEASDWLGKAKDINRTGRELPRLDEETKSLAKPLEVEEPDEIAAVQTSSSKLVKSAENGFILDFGEAAQNTLVLFRHSLVLGAAKNSFKPNDVFLPDLRIQAGFLSGQHAVLFRHLRHGEVQYWITPHPSMHLHCGLQIQRKNGKRKVRKTLDFESSRACWELQDGDLIRLTGESEDAVAIRFRLLEVNDALQATKTPVGKSAALELLNHRYISKHASGRTESHSAVMFHQNLLLCNDSSQKCRHIRMLPGKSISVAEDLKGLKIISEDACVLCDTLEGDELPDDYLRYDSSLSIGNYVTDNSDLLSKGQPEVTIRVYRI